MEDEIQKKLDKFEKTTKENIENWLSGSYDQQTKDKIIKLLSSDPNALKDAFFQKLTFGTAGARGSERPGWATSTLSNSSWKAITVSRTRVSII